MVASYDIMSIGRRIRQLCRTEGCLPHEAQVRALDEFGVAEESRNSVIVEINRIEEEWLSSHRPEPTRSAIHGRGWHRVPTESAPSHKKPQIVDVRKLAANDKD